MLKKYNYLFIVIIVTLIPQLILSRVVITFAASKTFKTTVSNKPPELLSGDFPVNFQHEDIALSFVKIEGEFSKGQTVVLSLPETVKFRGAKVTTYGKNGKKHTMFTLENAKEPIKSEYANADYTGSVNDYRVKVTVKNENTNSIIIETFGSVEAIFTGKIIMNVKVGDFKQAIDVGTAVQPLTVLTESTAINTGYYISAKDILIKENRAGALKKLSRSNNKEDGLILGVDGLVISLKSKPEPLSVSIVKGDLVIGKPVFEPSELSEFALYDYLKIPIEKESTVPSEILITNIALKRESSNPVPALTAAITLRGAPVANFSKEGNYGTFTTRYYPVFHDYVHHRRNRNTVYLRMNSKTMLVNGKYTELTATPYETNEGDIMIPVRPVLEAMGYNFIWNSDEKSITIDASDEYYYGEYTYKLFVDQSEYTFNGLTYDYYYGELYSSSIPPVIKNGHLYMPSYLLSEVIHYTFHVTEAETDFIKINAETSIIQAYDY